MNTLNAVWGWVRRAFAWPLDELFPWLGLESGGESLPEELFSADPLSAAARAVR